ncbi:hypothetical protein [Halopseudomonas maritima]|uniref:hypothetical protein n=1 Tax=Halopseudomonas maritima TaxID=2918528 RepID=UPI001EEC074C|nr:hypothetical protein [Halopseudomonas maritima]UJJ29962.1 hypothetical protein HV822_09075 [Halopseudomonas maritima]
MSRKTWRDLARQKQRPEPTPANTDLRQLAGQVPGLQRLLEQRDTLQQQMRRLGGQGDDSAPAERVYPVASASERRAEHSAWERQRDQQLAPSALAQVRQAAGSARRWQQQRERQQQQAGHRAGQALQQQRALMQRLDQRIEQARQAARERPREALAAPLLRPLQDRLEGAFQAPAAVASLSEFDARYQRRQQRLLGIDTGSLDDLVTRAQQLAERRLQERREARQAQRQQERQQARAEERRRQRPKLSTD